MLDLLVKQPDLDHGNNDLPPLEKSERGESYRPIKAYFLFSNFFIQPSLRYVKNEKMQDVKVYKKIHFNSLYDGLSSLDKEHKHIPEFDYPASDFIIINEELSSLVDYADSHLGRRDSGRKIKEINFFIIAGYDSSTGYMQNLNDARLIHAQIDDCISGIYLRDIKLFAYGFNGF